MNSFSKELIWQLNPALLSPKYNPLLRKKGFCVKISFSFLINEFSRNIEKSDKPPKIEICIKLSQIFDKPIDYIFPQIFLIKNTSKTCEENKEVM